MTCPDALRTQAHFDGEVDAVTAAATESHVETCAECRALLSDLDDVRRAMRATAPRITPPALRARIMTALDAEMPSTAPPARPRPSPWRTRPFWLGAFGGMGGTAIAAGLAFLLLAPALNQGLLDQLAAAHVRSLMPEHLIDVVSTDQHTVKPWFAGHADVSPVVADFAPQGYRLVGGRADYLDRQRSAVVVYQHGPHVINVFSWATQGRALPGNSTRKGYRIACWQVKDLQYCAVSDTGWDELQGLVTLLEDSSARDRRE